MKRIALVLTAALGLLAAAGAQTPITGTTNWYSFKNLGFESVNRADLDMRVAIPLFSRPGRGISLSLGEIMDSLIWSNTGSAWTPAAGFGWQLETPFGNLNISSYTGTCGNTSYFWYGDDSHRYGAFGAWGGDDGSGSYTVYSYDFQDPSGTDHVFTPTFTDVSFSDPNGLGTDCPSESSAFKQYAPDGSGWQLVVNGVEDVYVLDNAGNKYLTGEVIDRNGNVISASADGDVTTYFDAMGTAVTATVTGSPATQIAYAYLGANGSTQTVTVKFTSTSVTTSLGCSGVTEWSGTANLLTEIDLPNSTKYQFTYDSNAFLHTATLPTGAVITYAPTFDCTTAGLSHLTRTVDSASTSWSWNVTGGPPTLTTETDPDGNLAKFQTLTGTLYTADYYKTSSSDAVTQTYCYNGAVLCYLGPTFPITALAVTTTLNDTGENQKVATTFDTAGNATEVDQSDWYTSGSPTWLRKTLTSYATLTGLGEFPSTVTTEDGSGAWVAETAYSYDGASLTTTSGVTNHTSAPATARGNVTQIANYLNSSGSSSLASALTYFDTGMVKSQTDPAGNVTSFDYTDNFSGAPGGTNAQAFATTVTYPQTGCPSSCISHVETHSYVWASGQPYQDTDQNGQVTTYTYSDPLNRITATNYPDGGETTEAYTDGSASTLETKVKIDALGHWTDSFVTLDDQGRAVSQASANGESGSATWDRADTCYDVAGLATFASYPYQAASATGAPACSGSMPAGDATAFDGLGRPISVTHADGSTATNTYTGRAVEATDEGNGTQTAKRITVADGVGNIASVCEVTTASDAATNSPGSCGTDSSGATGFVTTYGHDPLGNLTSVSQSGTANSETRSFVFDSLSRLTSATNPESGVVTYTYDNDSNVLTRISPAPNQTGSATVTTTYSWDALNRPTGVSYSGGPATPSVTRVYDLSSWWWPVAYGAGRLTGEITSNGLSGGFSGVAYSYDAVGRAARESACTPNTCGWSGFDLLHTFDLAGDATIDNYARGATLTTAFNQALRPTGMTSSWSDATHPATLVSSTTHNARGEEWAASGASAALGNGMGEMRTYTPRGLPAGLWTAPGTPSAPGLSAHIDVVEGPGGGSTLAQYANLAVSGWAVDNALGSPVAQVTVLVDGTALGNATLGGLRTDVGAFFSRGDDDLAGWTLIANIGALSAGTHTVTVTASDAMGDTFSTSGGTITVTANQAPDGFIEPPSSSSVAQGATITAGGWATDPDTGAPVSQVQVLVDGVPVGNATLGGSRPDVAASTGRSEDLYSGWSLTFNVGSLAPGSHVLSAVATDPAGGSAALTQWGGPADETFTVSGGALAFGHFDSGDASPLSAAYGGSLTVSGWAVDGVLVSPASKVQIRVDGTPMAAAVPSGSRPDVATYLGNSGYTNSGFSTTLYLGNLAAGTHIVSAWVYDSLGITAQVAGPDLTLNVTGGNAYAMETSYAPNGSVTGVTDTVNGTWSYGLDALNRLTAANCTAHCPGNTPAQGFAWSYDRYGNRWSQTVTAGSGLAPSASVNTHNQMTGLTGVSYDAAGNLSSDGSHQYTYDDENRLIGVDWDGVAADCNTATACYQYGPDGQRVWENVAGTVREFFYASSGQVRTVVDASQNLIDGEIAFDGRHLATYESGGTTFSHTDPLGNERARTDTSENLAQQCNNDPFGDALNCTSSGDPLHFTGQAHDGETNLDFFNARHYSNTFGRFLQPDPGWMLSADPSNPQSWNQYAYSLDNPVTFTDPSGLITVMYGNCFYDLEPVNNDAGKVYGYNVTNLGCMGGNLNGNNKQPVGRGGTAPGGGGSSVVQPIGPVPPPLPPCRLAAPGGQYTVDRDAIALFQPSMAAAMTNAFSSLNSSGIVPNIDSGFRSPASQANQVATGNGVALSLHEVGLAVDINSRVPEFATIKQTMLNNGFTWGGTFRNPKPEPWHFQAVPPGTSPTQMQIAACASR